MARGVSIAGTAFAASGVSYSTNRNLITEQAMGLGGEPAVYSGGSVTTGTIDAAYRTTLRTYATTLNAIIADGTAITWAGTTNRSLIVADEKGGISFPSVAVNSFELSMNAKEYGRCTLGFLATGTTSSASGTAGSYAGKFPLFYSSTISGVASAMGFSIKLEVPVDQDYFVIGSSSLQDILQNGNGTISGTLKVGPTEWSKIITASGGSGEIGDITVQLNDGDGGDLGSINVSDVVVESVSVSGQGRNRFEKSITWRAPCDGINNINDDIFRVT